MKIRLASRNRLVTLLIGACVLFLGLTLANRSANTGSLTLSVTAQSATTLTIGSSFLWTCTGTNNTGAALTFGLNFYLITPVTGTKILVRPPIPPRSVANGINLPIASNTTTSAYSAEMGNYTFECDAVDASNNILATTNTNFTIQAPPSAVIQPMFTDVASAVGISMTHHMDQKDCMNMMGTGAGFADYNRDGFLDLFVSDYNGASHLYRNNGNLSFTDVTATAFPNNLTNGSLNLMHATGVSWADYDNDGFPDLLVLVGMGDPYLFHNNGDGTFTNVAKTAGLTGFLNPMDGMALRGSSAAWGDYDSDGYLDLYIVNYMGCMMPGMVLGPGMGDPDLLFHNNGDGTFTFVDSLLGGETALQVTGVGFAATWFDFNNDNRPDLYVVNDRGGVVEPNVLWRNDGPGGANGWIFTDVSASSGTNQKNSNMGVGVIDFNRDGFMDLMASNLTDNTLLQNKGNGTFASVARATGFNRQGVVSNTSETPLVNVTWGIAAADFLNHGYEDVIMGGGAMNTVQVYMPDALLINNFNHNVTGNANDGVFLDWTYAAGLNNVNTSPTIAVADFDADGWMDFVQVNYRNQAVNLYRNESAAHGATNNWLEVRLVGGCMKCARNSGVSNYDGVGAKLTLTAGADTQYRQTFSGSSLGAGNQIPAHFGLGTHTNADNITLTILWPSGQTQTFSGLAVNQRIVVTEGSSTLGNDPTPPRQPL